MKVREIMTSGSLATATLDATLEEIANMMKAENVGAIPVLDDDEKLAGLITDRDIVIRAIAEGEDPTECTAEDILSEQLHTIGPDADVLEAIDLMSRHRVRRLPVVEEEQVVGILSLGDVSVKSGQEGAGEALEEISIGVRQGFTDELVNAEGEEEPEVQNAGGGQARQRARQDIKARAGKARSEKARSGQQSSSRGRQQSSARGRQDSSTRGRQGSSARGRDSVQVRSEDAGRSGGGNAQGISNRSVRQENQRQQKVAPMRAEGKPRGQNKRKVG